eukprot:gnl/TRDRNA2_/TRDRNA2_198951_c0_seq1.p1 gnl/TRDRNA2_/TRDRNA2_198951_c0~~gnl/TRDRNA2_/TRDRNA2_198951_c0_seq1.p1  ORF type:complete len:213 (+),score=27.44 gnl/TRDRNA2_/TRDRNA2_198951_c0_seq1:80-718(+)
MAAENPDWSLPFLAVGRVAEGITIANYNTSDTEEVREQMRDIFKKLLGAAQHKLQKGQRMRLEWSEATVCCLMDQTGQFLYCVITGTHAYPEPLAYRLLYDLVVAVQSIDEKYRMGEENCAQEILVTRMRELITQYEDPRKQQGPPEVVQVSAPEPTPSHPGAGQTLGSRPAHTRELAMVNQGPAATNRKLIIYGFLGVLVLLATIFAMSRH